MEPDKALIMFEKNLEKMEKIGKYDSINVIVEMAMILGYDYALCEGDEK